MSLGLSWCLTSHADTAGEPKVEYGQFDVSRTGVELARLLVPEGKLGSIDADETVSWRMYVPDSYAPGTPAGLMVYISPTSSGRIRHDWQSVFETENLIWISANESGNRTPVKRRLLLAALAPYVASERYAIDSARVYLSGFSGGGKTAGIASVHLATLFKGAIFICGAELRSDVQAAQFAAAAPNRYVFVTGSRDFNRTLTKRVYNEYIRAGLVNSRLMIIGGMDHDTPDGVHFRQAVLFLDRHD